MKLYVDGLQVGQNPTEAGAHMVDIVKELGLV